MAVLQPGSQKDVFVDLTEGAALLPCEITAIPTGSRLVPADATWWPAETENDTTIRVLIGPTANALQPGVYDLYVRITDTPRVPIEYSGLLTIL